MKQKQRIDTKTLTGMSLMCAVNVALGWFKIPVAPGLNIYLTFLAASACGFLYGPVASGCCSALADLIKHFINPSGPFMISFTLIESLGGFLYGLVLHKKVSMPRAFLAKALVTVLCNLILTPIALAPLMGKTVWALMSARLVKNIVLWPFESLAIYFVLTHLKKIQERI